MMKIVPSNDEQTIAVEFDGKATKEDAEKLDSYAEQRFDSNEKFNLFAVMHDVDGSSLKGMIEGMKVDAKHWNQYRKIAVVSDKSWIEKAGNLGNLLPGIESKHFEKNQTEEAWEWIRH